MAERSLSPVQYCEAHLKERHRERYWATLYMSAVQREVATVLFAFDDEIASIAHKVSEAAPGEIRIQFWRDFLKGANPGGEFAGPLGEALKHIIEQYGVSAPALDQYLDARIFDLYHDPMPDQATLEGYLGETVSMLFHQIALSDGADANAHLADLSGHAGVAIGILHVLQDLHRTHRKGQVYVPLDLLQGCGLEPQTFLAMAESGYHREVISFMVATGLEHFTKAKLHLNDTAPNTRNVFRELALVEPLLKRIERDPLMIFSGPVLTNPLFSYYRLWRGLK